MDVADREATTPLSAGAGRVCGSASALDCDCPYNGASSRFDWLVFLDRCDMRPTRRMDGSGGRLKPRQAADLGSAAQGGAYDPADAASAPAGAGVL